MFSDNTLARRHRRTTALLIGALLPLATLQTTAFGAEQAAADSSSDGSADSTQNDSFFDSVTVTATGAERDTLQVATPVTVVGRDTIERQQPDNAADLLRTQPGVDVNGVGPNQARPVIRGLRGLRVLFLEDGLRMNNPRRQTDFGEVTGLVDLDSINAVEVVRGPSSVLYGSDAIGGVLNLIPSVPHLEAGVDWTGQLSLRYGSAADTRRAAFSFAGRSGDFDYQLGGSRRQSDDYDAPQGSFGKIHLDRSTPVRDSGVTDDSVWGSFGWKISDDQSLRLRFNRYRADQTGFGLVDPPAIGDDSGTIVRIVYPYQNYDRAVLDYEAKNLGSTLADSVDAKLYWQQNDRQLNNNIFINIGPVGPNFPDSSVVADTRNVTNLDTFGLRAMAYKSLRGRDLLTYGTEVYRDDSKNTDDSKFTTTIRFPFFPFESVSVDRDKIANVPNATNYSWALFAQDEVQLRDRLRLTGGLRYQKVTTRAESTSGWDTAGLDFSDSQVVGAAMASWQFMPELNGFASFGRGFRAPSIIERLFNGPTPEGTGFQILNADLSSEHSDNWDLGVKYRRHDALMELTFFRNDLNNGVIQHFLSAAEVAALPASLQQQIEDSGAQFVVQQRNVDKLRYQGYELALAYHAPFAVTFSGNYSHIKASRLNAANPPTGDSYGDKFIAQARWEPPAKRYWLEYRLRHNASVKANLDPDQPVPPVGKTLPAFTTHALAAGVTLYQRGEQKHQLDIDIENLTDELYAEFSNSQFFRPEPGRNVKLSYRLSF